MEKMQIKRESLTIRELSEGYVNKDETEEGGVFSMNGKLNIRPKYQRSYIRQTDNKWKQHLIESVMNGYPIQSFYFGVNGDGTFDEIDGQQRTITINDFIHNIFKIKISKKPYFFDNLSKEVQNDILNYKIDVNYCIGNEDEKLKWFNIINEPNSPLTQQELRNSVYGGDWLESAKTYFSAPTSKSVREITDKNEKYCFKYYSSGKIERQDFLEEILDWISYYSYGNAMTKDERINHYMSEHQHDEDANELITFYKKVIDWIWKLFLTDIDDNDFANIPHSMSNVKWGKLYTDFGEIDFDGKYCTERMRFYLDNDSITQQSRIYDFILSGEKRENENILQPRSLTKKQKISLYEKQHHKSPIDGKEYDLKEMETHHIVPFSLGGKTDLNNCILVSKEQHERYLHLCVYNSDEILKLVQQFYEYEKLRKTA